MVVFVAHGVEVFALTWWGWIERLPCAQVNAGDHDVEMYPAIRFFMLNGCQVDVLPIQSGKGQRFEVVQYRADFLRPRRFFNSP
uniref:Uncharacterized protein n=1 Tax=uncultured prokaryote TaxID=198431 RepID=A0A0H5Q2H6_9ZZZZ|nr:hypothetical protein [uncultured prokaryote]